MATAYLTGFGDEISPSLTEQMDLMEKLDYRAIEMRVVDGKNISEVTLDEAREIKERMDKRGFAVSALGSPIGKTSVIEPFEPVMETFKRLLETAKTLRTKYIRLFSFYIPEREHARYKDEVFTRLSSLCDEARNTGIVLLHENELGIYGDTSERCMELAEAMPKECFALICDPSNFIQNGEDAPSAYRALRTHVRYFHMKDSAAKEELDGNPHCLVGDGDGGIGEIFDDIAKTDFNGYFSLEPHLAGGDRVPGTPAEKWAAAANSLRALLDRRGIKIVRQG